MRYFGDIESAVDPIMLHSNGRQTVTLFFDMLVWFIHEQSDDISCTESLNVEQLSMPFANLVTLIFRIAAW